MKSFTSYATLAALVSAMACAGNTAKTDDPDQSAAARDTTTENPGYRGMEQDTAQAPGRTPSDTFLDQQGQGLPQDTAGYTGMERVDTTGQQGQTDTTGMTGADTTSGTTGADTSTTNQSGTQDSAPTGDTSGYDQSQGQDSTSR